MTSKFLKLLALALALTMAITCIFAGCGTKDEDKDDKDNKESTSDSAKDDGDKDDSDKDDKDDKDEDKPAKDDNTYETPVKLTEKYANMKTYYDEADASIDMMNGFCETELKALYNLMKKTSSYQDSLADAKAAFAEEVQDYKDTYGSDYKFTYKITDKTKLDSDALDEANDELIEQADALDSMVAMVEEFTDEDWESAAESQGFDTAADCKKYFELMADMAEVYKNADITEGYDLVIEVTVSGSELDEDEVYEEFEMTVLKIDGRWTSV